MVETCVPLRSDHKLGEADLNSASWSLGKTSLKAYKSENGGVMVPRNSVTSVGFKLGSWVRDKRDSVTSDGFKLGSWVRDKRDSVTSDGFKLGSWVRDKRDSVTSDGFKLGSWVRDKRSMGRLSSDQIKELDDLGFV